MDVNLFLTILAAVFAITAVNISLISWVRSDMQNFTVEIRGWKEEINKEMRDFHGRLCSIEEKNKK
jgi:hypothetical protein